MRKLLSCMAVTLVLLTGAAVAQENESRSAVVVTGSELSWGEPPPSLERGADFTVVSGDPSKAGIFVVRIKMPAGYRVAAHWHPTDEHVTVISGNFAIGIGDTFDKAAMKALPAGGYVYLPAEMRHYAMAETEATIQIEGPGPFELIYVNPAEDPRKRASSK